ncbi:2-hydroxyacid dehydrogenase [Melghirimyces algeriensis]|uniref:D-3-phosphoglycerate dehydrogenase n=1 Tax=Melghirimyces algeriensis TaxID=910412 RepID=A0A521CUU6_9BACL|nr:D-glycerate dehydrogenase [Melghirimyces algeriensis]SMO62430.1 D-3-phosphoglycerate dehydrogenase [Melghirimyces algeriensis]
MRNRPKVLVSRKIPFKGLSLLREYCEVTVGAEDRMLTRKELLKLIEGKDGVLSMLTDQMDKEVMDAAPDLKVISNYAVGYDNIDITEATRRGISVTNTPDVLTDATADLAWALLMDVARRVTEGDRLNRKGKWKEWAPMFHLGKEVTGSVLGIVGFGRIGRAMVKRALGFDMEIVYFSRTRLSPAEEQRLGVRYLSFTDLLQHADFVSLHAPYTKETHHLIGADELSRMKATAYLINTSRGGLIDEKALLTALREGKIAGAGLDVYEMEPQLTPGLEKLENVVLAPHLGSATRETRELMAWRAAKNVLAELFDDMGQSNRVN